MNPHTLPTIKQYISDSCRTFQEKTIPGGCQKNGSFAERFRALKHHSRRLRRMAMVFLLSPSRQEKPPVIPGVDKKGFSTRKNLQCGRMGKVWQPHHQNTGGSCQMNDVKSLSHSKWRCKYHIVFAPKYRRQVIYGKIKADVGKILRELSERKGVEIIEAECCPDHIHMLVAIPPHMSVAQYMGYLKSKSSLMIFDRHANLKYKYGNRHFWCRGYYVDTVGKYEGAIKEYIRNQLQEDIISDQISLKEFVDPFTGTPVKQGK